MSKSTIRIFGLNSSIAKARYLFSLPTLFNGHYKEPSFCFLEAKGHRFNYVNALDFNKQFIRHGDQYIVGCMNQGFHFSENDVKITQKLNEYFVSICDLENLYPEDFSTLVIELPSTFDLSDLKQNGPNADAFFESVIGRVENCVVSFDQGNGECTIYSKRGARSQKLENEGQVIKAMTILFQNTYDLEQTRSVHENVYRSFSDLKKVYSIQESYAFRKFGHIDSFLINDSGQFDEEKLLAIIERCSDPDVARALGTHAGVAMNGLHIATMASHLSLNRAQKHGLVTLYKNSSLLQSLIKKESFDSGNYGVPEGFEFINSAGLKTGSVDFKLYTEDPVIENIKKLSSFR